MHNRFLPWLILWALLASVSLRAQPAPSGSIAGGAERVLAARVTGTVQVLVEGQTAPLRASDRVPQTAKIVTGPNSSVVLVFSNGATIQLGADTEMVIDEFLQDPFASTVRVAEMAEEPSRSRTRLSLNRGELVGNVKKLKHAEGSSFTVTTPVGAAGIRGTTFRIVFRPAGTGQAFGAAAQPYEFSITTLEGEVEFAQGTVGVPGAVSTTAPQSNTPVAPQSPPVVLPPGSPVAPQSSLPVAPPPGSPVTPQSSSPVTPQTSSSVVPQPSSPGVPQSGTPLALPSNTTFAPVSVSTGQALSVTVTVMRNPAGQIIVTGMPLVTGTTNITPANAAQITQTAQQLITAITNTSFAPPPPPAITTPPVPTPPAPRTTPLDGAR